MAPLHQIMILENRVAAGNQEKGLTWERATNRQTAKWQE